VPLDLAAIPPDPSSPSGFRYVLVDPASPGERTDYRLYTDGVDGVDNGGAYFENEPDAALGRRSPRRGVDKVFNAVPPVDDP